MSHDAIKFALNCKGLLPQEKLVLIMLANHHAAGTGVCVPTVSRLAKDSGMSQQAILRWVKSLEERKIIEVIRCKQGRKRNKYNIIGLIGRKNGGAKAQTVVTARSWEVFWEEYPRKEGKAAAERAWNKLKPSQDLATAIITDIRKRTLVDYNLREKRFIPMASTYINGRRWEDELTEDSHKEQRMDWL
ncbi:MAG: helix-turn-helix domain-containing protein [Hyphomicrobiaceae bacterium]|nr:helix-turn-helix domain-containing protein [Hyphomicrobiaceae bacterium]